MSDQNPFQTPASIGLSDQRRAAPQTGGLTDTPVVFEFSEVLATGTRAFARAWFPVGVLSVFAYFGTLFSLCCCLLPGVFVVPLLAASIAGALIDAVDRRPVLSAARVDVFRHWRTLWPTNAGILLVYVLFVTPMSLLMLPAQVFLGRLSLVITFLPFVLVHIFAATIALAMFSTCEGGSGVFDQLRRAAAVSRKNLASIAGAALALTFVGAMLGLRGADHAADLLTLFRDPAHYVPPPTDWIALLLALPTMLLEVWLAFVGAAIYRTQVPRPPAI